MIINRHSLSTLNTGFKGNFQIGFEGVVPMWNRVATLVPSATATEEYAWLGAFPGMREWIGERQIKNLAQHGYSIKNRRFESTVSVPKTAIEDDQFGVYAPMMQEMGRSAAEHPDTLVFGLLKNAFASQCYDGQFFFDTDHPVVGADGVERSVSNVQAGSGAPWFLLDTRRALKPLIFQERKKPQFVAKDDPTDDRVFMKDEYVYGTDSRCNVGLGFWQMAFGSKADLTEANLRAAYTAMTTLKGDEDRPLGMLPNLLVVHPSLKFTADELLKAQMKNGGASNIMQGLVDSLASPWLA
ncbi:MAG: Mu-like prophage major head subunit gpT family protein [Rhizobiales bacterium]|nr:Mu-like prophage major head subunit gpT family protein [Hyphomicrobiales bacterium]